MSNKILIAGCITGFVLATAMAAPLPPSQSASDARGDEQEVIASGPPALTRGALRQIGTFLEFVLDSRFTGEEKIRFERAEIESWRVSTVQQRENTLQLARMQPVIEALGAAKREEVKHKVQTQLLDALRQSPSESLSKLLITVHQRSLASGGPAVAAAAASSGRVPRELVGEWSAVHSTSSVGFVNQATGSWAPPSGDGSSYRIFGDGRFEYTGLIQSSMYNCTMTITPHETGALRVEGGTIHFDSTGGTLDSKDNCNSRFNYRKPLAANTKSYSWKLERDQWGTKFCIWSPSVKETCVYKK